jgi:hypothetical protein
MIYAASKASRDMCCRLWTCIGLPRTCSLRQEEPVVSILPAPRDADPPVVGGCNMTGLNKPVHGYNEDLRKAQAAAMSS